VHALKKKKKDQSVKKHPSLLVTLIHLGIERLLTLGKRKTERVPVDLKRKLINSESQKVQ
jgi:copper homeostasis protein CutC